MGKITFCVILRAITLSRVAGMSKGSKRNDNKIQKNLACFVKELIECMAAHVILLLHLAVLYFAICCQIQFSAATFQI